MEALTPLVGIVIVLAALVGGNVQGGGWSIPGLNTMRVRVLVGTLGVLVLLFSNWAAVARLSTFEVECAETNECKGTPIACKVSDENPKETGVGNIWTYAPGSSEYGTRTVLVSDIRFGPWQNPECNLPNTTVGWSAKIGSCDKGKGDRRQRCTKVLVHQTLLQRMTSMLSSPTAAAN